MEKYVGTSEGRPLPRLANGVIQVEAVDDERRSIHGKKKPPDRSPKAASRPAGRAGDDGRIIYFPLELVKHIWKDCSSAPATVIGENPRLTRNGPNTT
jgi:hypothetical protein